MLPPKDVPMPTAGEEIYPQSLANAVTYIHEATGKPIIVSEHGINTTNDAERVKLIDDALFYLRNAMTAGVPVIGYYHWSLLDNFEWFSGFTPKFGLVAVDRNNFVRTPKPSAFHLGSIAQTNGSSQT
jgi:beta-glucosidase